MRRARRGASRIFEAEERCEELPLAMALTGPVRWSREHRENGGQRDAPEGGGGEESAEILDGGAVSV